MSANLYTSLIFAYVAQISAVIAFADNLMSSDIKLHNVVLPTYIPQSPLAGFKLNV